MTIYFGNDTTMSDHLLCRPDLEGGCTRCKVVPAGHCCELCTPAEFAQFAHVDLPKPKQQPSRSRIADYKAGRIDFALRDDLHAFRKARTIELRGRAIFRSLGRGLIMPDDVLQRIVDCAHFHKIQTCTELLKETRWHRVSEDGEQILHLIHQHRPPPPPHPPPPTPPAFVTPLRVINTNGSVMLSTPKVRQCSKCGLYGHIC
ncbi:hypothetical protein B0H16DRAFT_1412044 [Mycena metata]|uniref:Uncharacterized protein n=1 Tax=Mycena metata TaxID=1033252 RepID=A0AAD7JLQ9_9AGAR|nr:hypothetical protein B0H16DRAFT_1412044 [Mycena metata]